MITANKKRHDRAPSLTRDRDVFTHSAFKALTQTQYKRIQSRAVRVLPGTIPYHLGSSRELGMSQGNIISWKRIIGQPVTRFISEKRYFSHYKKRFFPMQRYPRRRPCPPLSGQGSRRTHKGGGVPPKSYFMSVDARLITARHVSISQKYLSRPGHTLRSSRKST